MSLFASVLQSIFACSLYCPLPLPAFVNDVLVFVVASLPAKGKRESRYTTYAVDENKLTWRRKHETGVYHRREYARTRCSLQARYLQDVESSSAILAGKSWLAFALTGTDHAGLRHYKRERGTSAVRTRSCL